MGIEPGHPMVEPIPPRTGFAVYTIDGIVEHFTAHLNAACVLPGGPSTGSWFRTPPFPGVQLRFASTTEAHQHTITPWPIPVCQSFSPAQFVLADLGYDSGWRVDSHPRFVADLTGDGRGDLIGFGDAGIWVALNDGAGGFGPAQFVLGDLGYGFGWRVDSHPQLVADLSGGGRGDLVGFGDAGVWVAYNSGDGSFGQPQFIIPYYGYGTKFNEWRVDKHPRQLARLTGSGGTDIVGFADDGVWVAIIQTAGPVAPQLAVSGFSPLDGGWNAQNHVRTVFDLTGDGRGDIIGFGDAGVWVALNEGVGSGPRPGILQPDPEGN